MPHKLSHKEYRLLVEKAPIMIWRAMLTMECDYFNETWLVFTGRSMAQEMGNGWTEGVHPDDLKKCLEFYTDHFRRRVIFEMHYRLRRFDGEYRWIFDRGVPYSNDAGIFQGYIGSCIDVTERIEAQEAEIKRLHGFLPICSYCKKIRNDRNYWEQLESYISSHSDALFSHSVCPECNARILSELCLSPVTNTR